MSVPPERVVRWVTNFTTGHGETDLSLADGGLHGRAADGSWFTAHLPFSDPYDGPAETDTFASAAALPADWGVLLVRKGGFAVARLSGSTLGESKTGQRHVQGRTKAGGQSQQRFARRRDNQARSAYEAAAEHAVRILTGVGRLVVGGDETAVRTVLADPRLKSAAENVCGPFLAVPDPRRGVLESAILDAGSVRISVQNA